MDSLDGEVLGYAEIDPDDDGITEITTTQIDRKLQEKHDIYFIFSGKGFELSHGILIKKQEIKKTEKG